jgi:DNA-binding NtrC family response regulator
MPSESGLTVFLMEDDRDTCANMRDIMELDGHRPTAVHTAADAFSHDDLKTADVILLDRRLPDGNAEELLPRIKRLAPQADVMVVTGHADLEGAISALRAGATDYLLKPIYPDALRASLSRIAQHRILQERLRQAERLAAIGQWSPAWPTKAVTPCSGARPADFDRKRI